MIVMRCLTARLRQCLCVALLAATVSCTTSRRQEGAGAQKPRAEAKATKKPKASKPAAQPTSTPPPAAPPATGAAAPAPAPAAAKTPEPADAEVTPPKRTYSSIYDEEFKAVFDLAEKHRWEEAEDKASQLYEADPQDPAIQRLQSWVVKQRRSARERAVEDKIREIDSKNSVFNPTLPGLLTENKDRGLPPRKDVRDAVDGIESMRYIPESYGKVIYEKGPLFDLEVEQGRMSKLLDKEISVQLDNVTLEAIIFNVGQAEGINFVADKALPAFAQKLSVNLSKVTLREFLRYISRNLEVQFQVGHDLIWIVDAKDPKKLQEETRFYRLREGFMLPAQFGPTEVQQTRTTTPQNVTTVTEVQKVSRFVNDGTPENPAIESAINKLFTGSKFLIDYERNLIVARGTPEQLEVIEHIIKEFDKPMQQVLIEARFVTVSQPAFMQLGVIWESGRTVTSTRSPTDLTGLVGTENLSKVGLGLQETFTNVFGSATLSATISALEQSGESQTLSAPRLTVINNRPATISDGKVQYYYEEYAVKTTLTQETQSSSFVPTGKPTKITSGVELDVMASISGDGKSLMLALHPKVTSDVKLVTFTTINEITAGGKQSSFDIRLPEYTTQDLATRVVVKSGQTVAMGGVLQREQTTYVESVPVLGSLPLLGALFRRRTEIDRPRYLLIFVTATILSESGEFLIFDDEEEKK